jgi:uncharacterized protein YndB with AHSA1/START domain
MNKIIVKTIVNVPLSKAWEYWTEPKHILQWNFASDDWECSNATNDLIVGGKFSSTMSAKDRSASFDFEGVYSEVIPMQKIAYDLADNRHIDVLFEEVDGGVEITETFDPEIENPTEMQQAGWQAILNNYKKYSESLN